MEQADCTPRAVKRNRVPYGFADGIIFWSAHGVRARATILNKSNSYSGKYLIFHEFFSLVLAPRAPSKQPVRKLWANRNEKKIEYPVVLGKFETKFSFA